MNLPLTLVAGYGRLVGRPSGVAHVYVGPMTPSGRMVPRSGRTVCHTRTRRLHLLPIDGPVLAPVGRRLCVRCSRRLEGAARRADQYRTREQFATAYGHLQTAHLTYATSLATNVDETHRLGFIAQLVLGAGNPRGDAEQRGIHGLHQQIAQRRKQIVAATRTPEEIEAARQACEIQAYNDQLAAAGRRRQMRIEQAHERHRRGSYLYPWERDLVAAN